MKQKVDELLETMTNIDNIRLISILDFGFEKSEIIWNLQQYQVKIYTPSDHRYHDRIDRVDQEDRQSLLRTNNIKLTYKYDIGNQKIEYYLFDVLVFPENIDQSQNLISNFRMFDGALVIIDITEGVSFQLQQFIRQASYEKIKLVLMIEKVNKAICELKQNAETIYQNFIQQIPFQINSKFRKWEICWLNQNGELFPLGQEKKGGPSLQQDLLKYIHLNSRLKPIKLQERFWGDNYFDAEGKCWRKDSTSESGKQLKRAFVAFIMDPIIKLVTAITQGNKDVLNQMLAQIGLKMTQDELNLEGKLLLKAVMSKWINAADTLLEMMVIHLPSPRTGPKIQNSLSL
ncbi:hypothetical protein pb186bvf_011808 [Paramecium bursaria]